MTLFHMILGSSDNAYILVLQKFGTSLHMTMGHSTLDSAIPDKFLKTPSYMLTFGEKDWSEDFALIVVWTSVYESPSS